MSLRIGGDQLASLGTVTEATIGHKETGDRTVGRCHVTLARRDTQACTSWRRAMIGVRKWMRIIHPMYVCICSSTRHGWMYWESTANEGPQLRDSLQGLLDETLPI